MAGSRHRRARWSEVRPGAANGRGSAHTASIGSVPSLAPKLCCENVSPPGQAELPVARPARAAVLFCSVLAADGTGRRMTV